MIELAQSFPASTFSGFDPQAEAIEAARTAAARAGVSDRVTFEVARAEAFGGSGYDLVIVFADADRGAETPDDDNVPRRCRTR